MVFMAARKASPPGRAAHRPADVLARAAHAGVFAVQRVVLVQVCGEPALHVAHRRRRRQLAVGQVVRDLAEDPRPAHRGAADHQRIGAACAASTAAALAGVSMSPLATTGTVSAAFTAATVSYSASPP